MLSFLTRYGLECHLRLLLFYSSFSLIRLKYNIIFHVQPLLFCLTISSLPHSLIPPFALFCFTPPSFSLPYSLQLPLYHHWSIKIRFTGFFSLFPPFFLALSSLFYDLIYRIGSSSRSCRFAVQSEPPPIYSLPSHKFHHQHTIKSPSPVIFPPFSPFFFRSLPSVLWSHTPNRFSSSQSCRFAVQAWYRRSEVHLGITIRRLEVHLGIADRKFILVSPYR